MSAPSRKAKRKPRRKAGKALANRRLRKLSFRLTVEGQEMRVIFTPKQSDCDYGRFEFRSPHRPHRRIPVSETGYFCHYAAMGHVRDAGSPEEFARGVVLDVLNRTYTSTKRMHDPRQLALFS